MLSQLKQRARRLRTDIQALALAMADARTPWYVRLLLVCVVAYAVSPVDLIPDFIPLLGYLDDLILLPAGIALALRLMPPELLAEFRTRAQSQPSFRPGKWLLFSIVVVIVALWLLAGWALWLVWQMY